MLSVVILGLLFQEIHVYRMRRALLEQQLFVAAVTVPEFKHATPTDLVLDLVS
jgi:hypothetical protein